MFKTRGIGRFKGRGCGSPPPGTLENVKGEISPFFESAASASFESAASALHLTWPHHIFALDLATPDWAAFDLAVLESAASTLDLAVLDLDVVIDP